MKNIIEPKPSVLKKIINEQEESAKSPFSINEQDKVSGPSTIAIKHKRNVREVFEASQKLGLDTASFLVLQALVKTQDSHRKPEALEELRLCVEQLEMSYAVSSAKEFIKERDEHE